MQARRGGAPTPGYGGGCEGYIYIERRQARQGASRGWTRPDSARRAHSLGLVIGLPIANHQSKSWRREAARTSLGSSFFLPSFLLSLLPCLVLPDSTLFSLFFSLPLFFHPNASVAVFQRESSLSLSLVRFRLDSIDQFLENCFHLDLKAGTIIGKIFITLQLGRNDDVAFSERGERGSVAECDRAACAIIDVCQSGSN